MHKISPFQNPVSTVICTVLIGIAEIRGSWPNSGTVNVFWLIVHFCLFTFFVNTIFSLTALVSATVYERTISRWHKWSAIVFLTLWVGFFVFQSLWSLWYVWGF